jgi:hypothetical protein
LYCIFPGSPPSEFSPSWVLQQVSSAPWKCWKHSNTSPARETF